jgi:nicotinamidase-related amidase
MIRPVITLRRKQIIVDIDTQRDYFLAAGKACIRNHRRVLANIRRVTAWARLKNVRMISTAQIYNGNGNGNGHHFCQAGTDGQKKISYTIRNKHITFEADGCTDLPRDILRQYDQIILQKRCPDPFNEPRADRVLSELKVSEFILFGATTEEAIKATALGLLARRKNVTILVDAIGSIDKAAAEVALRQVVAKGANLAETKNLLGNSHLQLIGVCDCDRCQSRIKKYSSDVGDDS